MTKFSTGDIRHLASLSGLILSEDEVEPLRKNIEDVIAYVDKLDELDVSGVEPTYELTGLVNVSRDDLVDRGQVSREQLLGLAPEVVENQIKVPKVL